jgi:asparagine synthase (glutamine-hydrolysing)
MRLICGILCLNESEASEETLLAMAAQMNVARLRPSLGLWRDGPVGLAVLDFSARGAPPFRLPERDSSVIAADVRLDEPNALRRSLEAAATAEEDDLLLAALRKHGPSGLDEISGDFAFASWDRSAQRLTCARDIFGVRPFAYVHVPGELFAFASFPKALHGSGVAPKTIDEEALARRIALVFRTDDTLIGGVRRLPPAHVLEVSRDGLSLEPYWRLDRAALGANRLPPQEAARELRRLVDEAVRRRLPRTGETGAHLSGGLDSSAISVLAARKLRDEGRRLHAYSFLDRQRNDIALEDETEFVEAVLAQEGDIDWTPIRPRAGVLDLGDPLDPDKMTSLDVESPENAVCARAEAQGVGLILSGWGGDEAATFSGRGIFAEMFLRGRWRALTREIHALELERGRSALQIVRSEIVAYVLPAGVVDVIKRIIGRDENAQALFRKSLSEGVRKRLEASRDEWLTMASDGRENRWRLITSPHIAERLEVWAQTGARHGIAFAFPLLDRRVVEFALSLPSELFLRDGFRRRPFRDAMLGVLPERVRLRHHKYMPFPGALIEFADHKDALLAKVDAYERNESVRRVIDLDAVRRLIETFPSPEQIREEMRNGKNPAAAPAMIVAGQALAAAEYLIQHGGGAEDRTSVVPSGAVE